MHKVIDTVAKVLVVIGALNWGLVAISPSAELIQYLQVGWLMTTIYGLVGLAGVWELFKLFKKR